MPSDDEDVVVNAIKTDARRYPDVQGHVRDVEGWILIPVPGTRFPNELCRSGVGIRQGARGANSVVRNDVGPGIRNMMSRRRQVTHRTRDASMRPVRRGVGTCDYARSRA